MTEIHLVLCRNFEGSLQWYAAAGAHVWLLESLENRKLAEAFWKKTKGSKQVSTFAAVHNGGLVDALELLDGHYGEYTSYEPIGSVTIHGADFPGNVIETMKEWEFSLVRADGSRLEFSADPE